MSFPQKKLLLTLIISALCGSLSFARDKVPQAAVVCKSKMGNVELKWTRVSNIKSLKLPAKIGTAKLPKAYTVFTVNAALLKQYMRELKKKGGAIVLPVPGNCTQFSVINSGTMSPELAAKFPDLISLKGTATDKTSTIRLDYDGVQLNAEMHLSGVPYIISPWKKGTTIYYLLYKKEDSGVERKPLSE